MGRRPALDLFINLKKWDELPKHYQAIDARPRPAKPDMRCRSQVRRAQPGGAKRLVAAGAQLRPFPQDVLEACYKAANEVYSRDRGQERGLQEDLRST